MNDGSASNMSDIDQAAVLLLSLGEEEAASLLKHLGPKEIQKIGAAMANMKNIAQQDVSMAIGRFIEEAKPMTGLAVNSDKHIRNVMTQALGKEKANAVVERILAGGNTKGLDSLAWMDAGTVLDIIRDEHPQIQAIILSYLDGEQAAGVIAMLPEESRADIVFRVATLDPVQPDALQELNEMVETTLVNTKTTPPRTMGGTKVAADILNNLHGDIESEVMDAIKEIDEDLGNKIDELMVVFDDLKAVDDRGIQSILKEISSEVLIVALKGADEDMQEKIFGNMSKRAAELLKDDLEAKGPVKLSEVESAQKEILLVAKRLAESGDIVLGTGGEPML